MDIIKKIRKMKVKEVMNTDTGWLEEDEPVEKAVNVLCSNEMSMIPVRNKKGELVGEVVERDLLKTIINPEHMPTERIASEPLLGMSFFPKKVKDVMRKVKISFKPEDTLEKVAKTLYETDTTLAPIMENNKMIGLISEDRLISLLSEPQGSLECRVVKLVEEDI